MACSGAAMEVLLALFLFCNFLNIIPHLPLSEALTSDQNLCSSSSSSSSSSANNFDYQEALSKGILFFEGQRSGKLPITQRVRWRGDSGLLDGELEEVELIGGYYDAGDNVKFAWPMAFSTTLLSWAAIEYQWELSSGDQLGRLHEAIKWGTDFILRANTGTNILYTQVGDANVDHQCWERPEDMDTPRSLYKIDHITPGTEVAAEAAAALAAASIAFKKVTPRYSSKLLRRARYLFQFAEKYRASYQGSCPSYCSYTGYEDELLWAAAWLYKATGENIFFHFLFSNQIWSHPVAEFSWDNKLAGVQILMAKDFYDGKTNLSNYKSDADAFVCAMMPGSSSVQVKTTPGGLLYIRDSSNMQYASSAALILLYYANVLNAARTSSTIQCGSISFTPAKITAFAQSQIDYILGRNPIGMSYMVGFGNKYPMQLHHRGASIPSIHVQPEKVGCTNEWYSSKVPNPNVHVGAIVGGPIANDQFNDLRSDYNHLEPTTYTNAAFVASVAAVLGQVKEADCLQMPHEHDMNHTSSSQEYY